MTVNDGEAFLGALRRPWQVCGWERNPGLLFMVCKYGSYHLPELNDLQCMPHLAMFMCCVVIRCRACQVWGVRKLQERECK